MSWAGLRRITISFVAEALQWDDLAPIWVDFLAINLEDTEACQIMRMLIFCVHTLKIRVKKLTLIAGKVDCTMVNLVRMFSTSLEKMKLIDCMKWSKAGVRLGHY